MHVRTLILGAGAAGLMAAGQTGPDTLVLDHAKAPGEKIRISGGGRCNFTNIDASPSQFLSQNKHFMKSALASYTAADFVALVEKHRIPYHEKTLGQLFCDNSAKDIIRLLLDEMPGELRLNTTITEVTHDGSAFGVTTETEGRSRKVTSNTLIVATGGKSIPKMGATGLAYDIARQFGHKVTEIRPALVPFTYPDGRYKQLSGVSTPVRATAGKQSFEEALLFTHRGLSGPAALQISSYWREGDVITLDLLPATDVTETLREARRARGRQNVTTELSRHLPDRLVDSIAQQVDLKGNLGDLSDKRIAALATHLHRHRTMPSGTEGYRTAEVTLGGIDTKGLDSRTMMSKIVPNLYFIGEAVDVTGWLGGYNFQWAWSSAVSAGRACGNQ